MKILGIETSCDETALALLEAEKREDGTYFKVLGNVVHSQIDMHKEFGGVVPMLAKREHGKNLVPLLKKILENSSAGSCPLLAKEGVARVAAGRGEVGDVLSKEPELLASFLASPELFQNPGIDAIAVTHGPGLEPALWVGISFAKVLGLLWNVPVIPTNHMEGHIVASLMPTNLSPGASFSIHSLQFPALALLISGGHTELVKIDDWQKYTIIGQTRDDAIGEAFDKVARLLDLPYPGGPEISKLAETDRAKRSEAKKWNLPRPMLHSKDFDFSFSGLKTSVLYTLRDMDKSLHPHYKEEIAREFEDAVTEVLVTKSKKALEEWGAATLIVGGGVIANKHIRTALEELAKKLQVVVLFPEKHLSTDNALMIALAGYFRLGEKETPITAQGNLKLS